MGKFDKLHAKNHEVVIGENTFWIKKYEPFLGIEILGTLQKFFLAPALAAAEVADSKGRSEADLMSMLIQSIEKVSKSLDGQTLRELFRLVIREECVAIEGENEKPIRLTESVINGAMDVSDLIQLFIEVVTVNYKQVFTDAMSRIGQGLSSKTASLSELSVMN